MPGVREFFQTPKGQMVAAVLGAIGLAAAAYSIYSNVGASPEVASANTRWFVDAESKKGFQLDLSKATVPAVSPFSGKKTGYPAELCYWTKDGKPKADPTPVLLNGAIGVAGPTFCPDCGRLVVPYNPLANVPNAKVPPTQAEYAASGRRDGE